MRKILVAAATVAAMAQVTWAEECKYNGASFYCQYENKGVKECWGPMDSQYDDKGRACDGTSADNGIIQNCLTNGVMFDNSSVTGVGNACTGTKIGGTENCSGFCDWDQMNGASSNCYAIKPNPNDTNNPTTTCEEATAVCELYGQKVTSCSSVTPSSSSIDDPYCIQFPTAPQCLGPIIVSLSSTAAANSLASMNNGVNISVAKEATVKVFDLKGNAIRTLMFSQGSYNLSLQDLPRGLYIVKATGASWNKTVTVPVK